MRRCTLKYNWRLDLAGVLMAIWLVLTVMTSMDLVHNNILHVEEQEEQYIKQPPTAATTTTASLRQLQEQYEAEKDKQQNPFASKPKENSSQQSPQSNTQALPQNNNQALSSWKTPKRIRPSPLGFVNFTALSPQQQTLLNNTTTWMPNVTLILCNQTDPKHSSHLSKVIHNMATADVASTIPWPNLTTIAYPGRLFSGFRNQMMYINTFMMLAKKAGHGQVLLNSLSFKDTHGTDARIPFEELWDVPHWNSYYPRLPRLVYWDPILHDQYEPNRPPSDVKSSGKWLRLSMSDTEKLVLQRQQEDDELPQQGWKTLRLQPISSSLLLDDTTTTKKPNKDNDEQEKSPTEYYVNPDRSLITSFPVRPYGPTPFGMSEWKMYSQLNLKSPLLEGGHRNSIEALMMREAWKPSVALQRLIDDRLNQMTDHGTKSYMTLHARVEPDMQKHPVCFPKKVFRLQEILNQLYVQWPEHYDPPVDVVFLPINRQFLEQDGTLDPTTNRTKVTSTKIKDGADKKTATNVVDKDGVNWVAVENLRLLNQIRDHGLWQGRVKVVEFGANSLRGTPFAKRPSTNGAMLNYWIGVGAKILVGTEVSTFSIDLMATRFFRNNMENYKYLPSGLEHWTPPGSQDPPGFSC